MRELIRWSFLASRGGRVSRSNSSPSMMSAKHGKRSVKQQIMTMRNLWGGEGVQRYVRRILRGQVHAYVDKGRGTPISTFNITGQISDQLPAGRR
jgi:hypothetical protein